MKLSVCNNVGGMAAVLAEHEDNSWIAFLCDTESTSSNNEIYAFCMEMWNGVDGWAHKANRWWY